MDRRIGVFGSALEAGRKAMFLRTYSREVLLFASVGNADAELQDALTQAGIKRAGKPRWSGML
jgi:hypothetical protein